jgi:hypothetical protein
MSFITKNLKQDCVYWGNPAPDGYGGNTFDDYVAIKCRWEDRTTKFIDANGEESISKAVVYLPQDVELGGWLFLGELSDISSANQDAPQNISGAHEIRAFNKIPNIKGTDFEREAMV